MEIARQNIDKYVIYRLKGALDHDSIGFVLGEIGLPKDTPVIIDLNGISKIDSTGYGLLIKLWKGITLKGGEIHVLCNNRKFLDKLRDLNLHKVLHIFEDDAEFRNLREKEGDILSRVKVSMVENFKVLTLGSAPETMKDSLVFKEYLLDQVDHGAVYLAIDFSLVSHVYSDLISAILEAKARIDSKKGWLVFIGVREELFGIFECVGMDRIVTYYPDLKAFLVSLKGRNAILDADLGRPEEP